MNAHQHVITDCMTDINVNAVRLLLNIWPICMIIICMDAHQRVITDCNQCECLAVRVCTTYKANSVFYLFFFFITHIILIVFLVLK